MTPPPAHNRLVAWRRALGAAPRLTHHTVAARGLRFAVYTSPPVPGATPLVCVNGGLVYDHNLIWPALSPLAKRRQLVLYDQRGRGKSQPPPGVRAARIEHDAGDIGALRDALGFRQWDVFGHSWGGGIALLGAEADRVGTRRLVTVDAVGPTSAWRESLERDALARLDTAGRAALERAAAQLAASDTIGAQSAYNQAIYPAWFADRALGVMFGPPRATSETGAAVASTVRRDGYDWRARMTHLPIPTLLVHGARDLLPATVATEWLALLANARVAVIPDAGHMPFWEQPELFFPVVDEFLAAP